MLQPDTLLNNRYRINHAVGEGGMATVYRAQDTRLGRTVAIKVLHQQFARDEPFLRRFQQEAEFAASLGAHPNIVAIYDIGQDDPYHYIVMEYVDGRSLKDLILEHAPFEVPTAFAIGRQVASALDFAHKRGLVHRDVKPQNIMVTDEGAAKVADFGIARSMTASQLTRTGVVIGTVHYFSPEQAQGKPADARSDIYSLGIILYEMLTGHLPFEAENAIGVAMQHVHSNPPSPWDFVPGLPARAVNVVMRALDKNPDHRYRDAEEFASALADQSITDAGHTTLYSPVGGPPREHTAVYQPLQPQQPSRTEYVAREPRVTRRTAAAEPAESNRWRTAWITLGAVVVLLAVGLASFFTTQHFFGSGSAATITPTQPPTSTPRPTPKPHRTHTPIPTTVPTQAPVIVFTDTPVPPTRVPVTDTPAPPPATPTPRPRPRPTFTPLPAATSTPQPLPLPTAAVAATANG